MKEKDAFEKTKEETCATAVHVAKMPQEMADLY